MSKIQDALNSFGGNFARPTKFNVRIGLPALLGGSSPDVVDILCKSVSLPEIQQTSIEMSFKGHKINYPGRVNQAQSVSLTFYIDEGYIIYDMFKDWIDIMDNKYYGKGQKNSKVVLKYGTMTLIAVDYKEKTKIKISNFEGVFPLSISEISYDGTNKDSVQEYTVQFAYFRNTDNPQLIRGFTTDKIGRAAVPESVMSELAKMRPPSDRIILRNPLNPIITPSKGGSNDER